jgi:hypothetical protein
MDGFCSNLRWTYYKSHQVAWAMCFACSSTARTRASARVVTHSIIFRRIFFKFAVHILQMTTSYMSYILIIFTHRAHASECTCLRAHAWFGVGLSLDGFSSNLLGTYYKSPQVAWATYFSWRVCVIACPNSTYQYTFANSDTYDT